MIITGLSGSGKSTALNALEDLDFYAVDNLPIKLLDKFIDLIEAGPSDVSKAAIVMDLRDQEFIKSSVGVFTQLQGQYNFIDILFLDSSDEVLLRRFNETRRKHPLSSESVEVGISKERALFKGLRELASATVDTSKMDVHRLKKDIQNRYTRLSESPLSVRISSFGYKHGIPKNCDIILDVRFLSNPHFVAELKTLTGLDTEVQSFILKDSRFAEFMEKTVDYLKFLIPQYQLEGKRYLSIGIGCTGGQHRSVYCAQRLLEELANHFESQLELSVEHSDLPLMNLSSSSSEPS